ncbi:Olfactory receptor 18 [Fukomys damarensis]|uniref:Olfactory receptor 18 n=1 Tax=Fukomys damarensis TaxID=885580 RepID=A0A091E0X9_FUKDA|nr:Olfactory receptor 18 [Fukomys damarensis]
MYLVAVLGNLLIILAIISDSHLHTPMYFFLSNLSLADIGFISTTVPKMIVDIPLQRIFFSYYKIVSSILRIPSSSGKHKAFSTCGSHLSVVCLFYGTAIGIYLTSSMSHSPKKMSAAQVMYTVVIPMLNPFIYSLRNKDMKHALRRLQSRAM